MTNFHSPVVVIPPAPHDRAGPLSASPAALPAERSVQANAVIWLRYTSLRCAEYSVPQLGR
jgi:hypothetical protein